MEHGGILIISGTNRPHSNAEKVARVIEGHYQSHKIAVSFLSLTNMGPEIFEPSAYQTKPPVMVALQQRVLAAGGLHIVTPEYNGSFPGVLKYFIDMLKFPESFDGKPVAFVGESGGSWGALRAVEHLQGIFGYRNAHIYRDRVFIPGIKQKFDEQGRLTDPSIDQRLAQQTKGFSQFIDRLRT
jgi:chromate reductase, NAD(P)H dehydrogenase (quinone)